MPLGLMESEPVREAMQTGHLTHGDAPVPLVVDGPWARECATCRVRARAQRVADPFWRQLEKTRDWLNLAWNGFCKAPARNIAVVGAHAGRHHGRIPGPAISERPAIHPVASHQRRIRTGFACLPDPNFVSDIQLLEPLGIRKIVQGVLAGGARRKARILQPGFRRECDRIAGHRQPALGAHQEQSLPILRNTVGIGVQYFPLSDHVIARSLKFLNELL